MKAVHVTLISVYMQKKGENSMVLPIFCKLVCLLFVNDYYKLLTTE